MPKEVAKVLVAQNGLGFDFLVLFYESARASINLSSVATEHNILFADSLDLFRAISSERAAGSW